MLDILTDMLFAELENQGTAPAEWIAAARARAVADEAGS